MHTQTKRLLILVCIFLVANNGWACFYTFVDNLWFFCELPTFVFYSIGYWVVFYWFVKACYNIEYCDGCGDVRPTQTTPSRRGLLPQLQKVLLAESLQLSCPSGMASAAKPPSSKSHSHHSSLHPKTDVMDGRL